MRWIFALLLALALPSTGWAGVWSKDCKFTGAAEAVTLGTASDTSLVVNEGKIACYRYTSAAPDTVGTVFPDFSLAKLIQVNAPSALICFDPNIYGTAVTGAQVTPHYCAQGATVQSTSAADQHESCISIGLLNGTEGSSATQNACVRVGPGFYFLEITAACTATTCQVSFQADEGD